MSEAPRIMLHFQPEPQALADAMTVMEDAFDPRFGEAWNAHQLAGMMDMPGSWLTLARIGNKAVGFALIRSVLDEAELLLIAVHREHRSRAIGRALIDHSLSTARSRGICSMHLEVRADNDAALLYKNAGFQQVSRRANYYRGSDGRRFDALTFRIAL